MRYIPDLYIITTSKKPLKWTYVKNSNYIGEGFYESDNMLIKNLAETDSETRPPLEIGIPLQITIDISTHDDLYHI